MDNLKEWDYSGLNVETTLRGHSLAGKYGPWPSLLPRFSSLRKYVNHGQTTDSFDTQHVLVDQQVHEVHRSSSQHVQHGMMVFIP